MTLGGFLLSVLAGDCGPVRPHNRGAPQAKDIHEEYFWTGSVQRSCALQGKSKIQMY